MAVLNWMVPKPHDPTHLESADGRTFKRGQKDVWLYSRFATRPPKRNVFTIHELSDAVRRRLVHGNEMAIAELVVGPHGSDAYIAGLWRVSTPNPWGEAQLYFTDGHRHGKSGLIGVTSAVAASEIRKDPSTEIGGNFTVAGIAGGGLKKRREPSGEIILTHDVKAAVDPSVEVSLLIPGGPDGHDLLPHVRDYTAALLGTELSDDEMAQRTEGALTPDRVGEWDASLENGELTMEFGMQAGEERAVDIRVRPPREGRFAYALMLKEVGTEFYSIGNVVVLDARGDDVIALL